MSVSQIQTPIAHHSLQEMGIDTSHHLTPDEMLMFLSVQLTAIDGEIQELFEKQQLIEKHKEHLSTIINQIPMVDGDKVPVTKEQKDIIEAELLALYQLDPVGFESLVKELDGVGIEIQVSKDGTSVSMNEDNFEENEANGFRSVLESRSSTLDSSAQLEMIKLQSLISERQQAIQLATNIVAAIGKSNEAIVGNIR